MNAESQPGREKALEAELIAAAALNSFAGYLRCTSIQPSLGFWSYQENLRISEAVPARSGHIVGRHITVASEELQTA